MTLPLTQLFDVPLMLVEGGVRSMLTAGLLVAVVDRPAPFVALCELVRPLPSPTIVVSAGAVGMPDSGSDAVQWTVTSPLYHPAVFGWVVGAPESSGAVVSPSRSCGARGRRVAGLVGGHAGHGDAGLHRLRVRGAAVRQAGRDARGVAGTRVGVLTREADGRRAVGVLRLRRRDGRSRLVDADRDRTDSTRVAQAVGLRRRRQGGDAVARDAVCLERLRTGNPGAGVSGRPVDRDVAVVPARRRWPPGSAPP